VTAFTESSSSLASEAETLPNSSVEFQKIVPSVAEEEEIGEWEYWEDNEEEGDDEEWEYYYEEDDEEAEYENEEEYENDDDDYEVDWSPEQYEEMDRLFVRYLEQVARKHGADWEDKFELVISKEEVYEEYLAHEEQKQELAEERRRLIEASHKALLKHDESSRVVEDHYYNTLENDSLNRTEEQDSIRSSLGKHMSTDLPPRTHMVVLKSNGQECQATTTIVTTQGGNTHTVIGSI
jgi:hypothetical protein